MAIVWTIDITNVDVENKRADVHAKRIDDTDPTVTPRIYKFSGAVLATPQDRLEILELIKTKVLADEAKESSIDTFVASLEADGKAALESWEASR